MKAKIIELEHLVDAFKSLPGVGMKNARKWANYIVNQDDRYIELFISKIQKAHEVIRKCATCFNLSTHIECDICSNKTRDHKVLCIVSSLDDLERIESSNSFNGVYHITNAVFTTKNLTEHKNLDTIKKRIKDHPEIKEVIIATSFSYDGQVTAEYICNLLKEFEYLSIYRIGFGVPLNGSIDYIDDETLKCSFNFKRKIN